MVKFWCRLSNNDLPVYLREAYLLAKNQRLDWYNSIVDIPESIGLDQMCDRFNKFSVVYIAKKSSTSGLRCYLSIVSLSNFSMKCVFQYFPHKKIALYGS